MYVKSDPGLPVHASPQVSLTRSLLSRRSAGRNQFSSLTQSCPTLRSHGLQHARPPYPSPPPGVYSKLMSMELVMPSNHLILSHPLLLPPSIFPSIRVFSNESVLLIRWPKYCSFNFSISPSNEYSGLISFKIDWFELIAVQAILKSLLPHCSSKASILWHSAFFTNSSAHKFFISCLLLHFLYSETGYKQMHFLTTHFCGGVFYRILIP